MSQGTRQRDAEIRRRMERRPLSAVGEHREGTHCRACGYVKCACAITDASDRTHYSYSPGIVAALDLLAREHEEVGHVVLKMRKGKPRKGKP